MDEVRWQVNDTNMMQLRKRQMQIVKRLMCHRSSLSLDVLRLFVSSFSPNKPAGLRVNSLGLCLSYITSGLKWCSRAQKASPFLQEVVKLVIFTPR